MNMNVFLVGSQILEHSTNSSNILNRRLRRNKDFVVSGKSTFMRFRPIPGKWERSYNEFTEIFPQCRSQDASDVQLVTKQISKTVLHAFNITPCAPSESKVLEPRPFLLPTVLSCERVCSLQNL